MHLRKTAAINFLGAYIAPALTCIYLTTKRHHKRTPFYEKKRKVISRSKYSGAQQWQRLKPLFLKRSYRIFPELSVIMRFIAAKKAPVELFHSCRIRPVVSLFPFLFLPLGCPWLSIFKRRIAVPPAPGLRY